MKNTYPWSLSSKATPSPFTSFHSPKTNFLNRPSKSSILATLPVSSNSLLDSSSSKTSHAACKSANLEAAFGLPRFRSGWREVMAFLAALVGGIKNTNSGEKGVGEVGSLLFHFVQRSVGFGFDEGVEEFRVDWIGRDIDLRFFCGVFDFIVLLGRYSRGVNFL